MHANFCEKKLPKLNFSCPKEIWWLDRKTNPKDLLFYQIVHFSKDLSSHSLINVFFSTSFTFFPKYAEIAFIPPIFTWA